jgi:hypothetical protein
LLQFVSELVLSLASPLGSQSLELLQEPPTSGPNRVDQWHTGLFGSTVSLLLITWETSGHEVSGAAGTSTGTRDNVVNSVGLLTAAVLADMFITLQNATVTLPHFQLSILYG